ncbi:endothelial cell-specific chemotaxis regulator isoform X2 [Dipodomys spectabilis]|uniref:endothelial cell-specific chemotaxis regulator isoform X2 n=1 Tax=Dipodomys spectabilis TaxID=105255 RepID=UPI001C54089A|nr:endothelial cell-specific chemotaxis regulator isoform X2 [Dipodomys spectabilis]
MGTTGATQLFWAILGLLLLQGHNSQPTTTQTSQGVFNSLRLTIEATLPNTGVPQEASWSSPVSPKPVVLRSSTVDGHSPSLLGLTQPQTQKLTSGLETSQNATPSSITTSLRTRGNLTIVPSPTSETVLTVAAFGVISFIVILVVVVIVLVGVVSLRFKCRKNKESEDPQKPGNSGVSESCSTANGEKDSITLISVKNINMNNSKGCPSAEKVL